MSSARTTPPVLPAPIAPRLPPVHACRFENGLELFVIEQRGLPVIDVRLIVRAGGVLDPPALAGRAQLMADLLDEGTTTRTAPQIADEAEHLGASLQTRASWDYSAAGLHVLAPRFEPALELLADVVRNASFPAAEVTRKRDERLAAIIQELDEPRIVASIAFTRTVYGDAHPFGAPLGGTRASVEALDADQLIAAYHERFSPDRAFFVLAGDIETAAANRLIERLFGDWSAGSAIHGTPGRSEAAGGAAQPPVEPGVPHRAACIRIIDRPGAPQSELRVGCNGPPRRSPDFFPLLVGNVILGGSFTSRLNMRLREEKAYTYGAASRFAFRAAGGPFLASTAVFTGATADAVHDVINEIARLGRELVSVDELERAQNYLVLGLPRTFETTSDVAEHVGELALYDLGSDYFDTYGARIRDVTREQVMDAISRWLPPERLVTVIAGDAAVIAEELRSLNLGPVEVSNAI